MQQPQRFGVPATSALLAPTTLSAPSMQQRVTVIPDLPLVPARSLLASVLAADTSARDVVWVELAENSGDDAAWEAIRATLAEASGKSLVGAPLPTVTAYVTTLKQPLLLVVPLASVSSTFDTQLLGLLGDAPRLSVVALCSGRRVFEGLGRADHDAVVVAPSELVLDAGGIRRCAAIFGLALSAEQAAALAHSSLSLPDLLPSVIASLSIDDIADQDDPVQYLLEESEHQLEVRLRGSKDAAIEGALRLAVPSTLTSRTLALVSPDSALQLDRVAQARLVQREHGASGARYRMDPVLRRLLLAELKLRNPALARELSCAVGRYFADTDEPFEAIDHFAIAEDWDAVVEVLDDVMFRMISEKPLQLHDAILAMPRKVRDDNPRFTLSLELGWQPREGLAQAWVSMARRAAGTFARLPKIMSPWDQLHVSIVKTIVFRLKGDLPAALEAARSLDELLASDDDLASRPAATLSEAHYQSGVTRLLTLDLVAARECFSSSYGLAQGSGDSALAAADRAAEAIALVRALEGEAEHATNWLTTLDGRETGTAGLVARALVAIGRLDGVEARRWLDLLSDVRDSNEFWAFAAHAENRYGLYWGDPVETEADLDRTWAEHGDHLVEGSTAQLLLSSDAADLAVVLGQLSRAEAALEKSPARNTWIAVSRARIALLGANPKHAMLFILEGQARGRTERYGQLDLAVLRAATELALGRHADATASLLRAIKQSEKSGVVVPFRLLPQQTLEALAALHPDASAFVAAHELTGTSYLAPYQAVAGALSERELVVLRALDPGATVEQVAKKLFVASNTVKAQLRSIYRKLNVSTRTEALLVAAELGLLDQNSRSA
jgi:LuxR family transcriptional regulator, maltose regulon positive regulatory protein